MNLFNSPQRTSSAQQRFVGGGQNTGMRTPPSAPYQDSNRSNDDYYRSYTGTEKIVLRVQIYKKKLATFKGITITYKTHNSLKAQSSYTDFHTMMHKQSYSSSHTYCTEIKTTHLYIYINALVQISLYQHAETHSRHKYQETINTLTPSIQFTYTSTNQRICNTLYEIPILHFKATI